MKKKTEKKVVLVGTYRGGQLAKWPGWYNWPVESVKWKVESGKCGRDALVASDGSAASTKPPMVGRDDPIAPQLPADFCQITELWLFQGTKEQKTFKAEFVGIKTREELIRDYGYPGDGVFNAETQRRREGGSRLSRPHGDPELSHAKSAKSAKGGSQLVATARRALRALQDNAPLPHRKRPPRRSGLRRRPHGGLREAFAEDRRAAQGVSKKKSLGRETGFRDKTQGTLFFDVADISKWQTNTDCFRCLEAWSFGDFFEVLSQPPKLRTSQ